MTLSRLWADFCANEPIGADFGPPLSRLWIDFGRTSEPTLGQLLATFGFALGRLLAEVSGSAHVQLHTTIAAVGRSCWSTTI